MGFGWGSLCRGEGVGDGGEARENTWGRGTTQPGLEVHWGQGKQRLQKEGRQSVTTGLRMGP